MSYPKSLMEFASEERKEKKLTGILAGAKMFYSS